MKNLIKKTFTHWSDHNASRMGAALSYYAMLSFIPLLLMIIILGALFLNKSVVVGTLTTYIRTALGSSSADYITGLLQNAGQTSSSGIAALIGGIAIIVGALGVFSELNNDLDELWDSSARKKQVSPTIWKKIVNFLREKLASFSLIPLIAIGLLISIASSFILNAVLSIIAVSPFVTVVLHILQVLIVLVVGTGLIALTYRILPNTTLPWRIILRGAALTAALFVVGDGIIVIYLKFMLSTSTYGAAGSLVGLLVWIYYSSQVFFLGASFTIVYAKSKKAIISRA